MPWPAAGREAVMSRRGKLGSVVATSDVLFAAAAATADSRFQKRGKERKRASARATRTSTSALLALPHRRDAPASSLEGTLRFRSHNMANT